ncbi:MAG: response regulator [Magnetococcales bacterium]|nr:response regulator [Magnetococcales bacterium]
MLTIRKKIAFALVGLVALVSAAMAIVGYVTLSSEMKQVQQDEMSLIALTQAMTINERLNSMRRQFVEMVTAREIDTYITEFKKNILSYHFQRFKNTFPYLLFANQKGEVEFQSATGSLLDGKPVATLTDLPQFSIAKEKPNQVLFFPVLEGLQGKPVLRMLYVVRTYFDDFGGAILGELPLFDLFSGFSVINPGETGFSMLVDDRGRILYHKDDSKLFHSFQDTWEKLDPIVQKITSRKEGFGNTLITGFPAVVAVAPVIDTPWSVVVVLPHKESLLPARKIGELYFMFFLIIALLGIFISWWLARTITTPLTMLDQATKSLAAGRMSTRVAIHSNDEVGGLIQSFNQMAQDLESSNQELQREVEERTRLESAHRKAKKDADSANKAKSEFLASMSHEIRTPMNAILGMTELLADRGLAPEIREGYIHVLKRNGEALLILINDILDLSRVESGQIILEEVPFDLQELTSEILSTFYVMVDSKNIKLLKSFTPGLSPIRRGDPTRIRQILVNLLSNSVKFTSNGEINLNISQAHGVPDPDYLRFTVSDTGIGIPEEKLETVFDQFIQVDSSSTRKYGGSGLGLSLCREFVSMMNGKIWVESKVGVGSQFMVEIPLPVAVLDKFEKEKDLTMTKPEKKVDVKSTALSKKRLLVVDDSEDNVLLIQAFLKGYDVDMILAENGKVGLAKYKDSQFDIVLMDIQMPVMDGYMATRAIREWELKNNKPRTAILALTANALRSDVDKSYAVGCDGHLSKPIDKKSFIKILIQLLQPIETTEI